MVLRVLRVGAGLLVGRVSGLFTVTGGLCLLGKAAFQRRSTTSGSAEPVVSGPADRSVHSGLGARTGRAARATNWVSSYPAIVRSRVVSAFSSAGSTARHRPPCPGEPFRLPDPPRPDGGPRR